MKPLHFQCDNVIKSGFIVMETDRSGFCGCKGIRTCIKCERAYGIENKNHSSFYKEGWSHFNFCDVCNKCFSGWDFQSHGNHSGDSFVLNGICVIRDFVTEEEEKSLIASLDELPWEPSQSGRRKQNFGPKCNFKKRKLRLGDFKGFPASTKFVQDKFSSIALLDGYRTIEQCSLEYDPDRGSSIDPHVDDCWIWGERILTVNLLSDSVLTLTPIPVNAKYNLSLAPPFVKSQPPSEASSPLVRILMPNRSLIVLCGDARYGWEHSVFRDDITSRRVCLAYREFTTPYLPGGEYEKESKEIMEVAQRDWF